MNNEKARAVAPVETPTRNCCQCNAPISRCMGFVKASDFVDLLNGVRPGIVDGHCNIRELCGRCSEVFMWDGENLIKREIVETRLTAEQFVRAILKPDPNHPDDDTFWLHFPHAIEEVENREFWLKHLPELLTEYLEAFRDKSEAALKDQLPSTFYADRPLLFRVQQLVRIWQNVVTSNARQESENAELREEIKRLKEANKNASNK